MFFLKIRLPRPVKASHTPSLTSEPHQGSPPINPTTSNVIATFLWMWATWCHNMMTWWCDMSTWHDVTWRRDMLVQLDMVMTIKIRSKAPFFSWRSPTTIQMQPEGVPSKITLGTLSTGALKMFMKTNKWSPVKLQIFTSFLLCCYCFYIQNMSQNICMTCFNEGCCEASCQPNF